MTQLPINDRQYAEWFTELKTKIHQARLKATLSVNRELIVLYWQIGREILDRQQTQGWGSKVVTQLSKDLRQAFPEMTGLSRTNLLYMLYAGVCRSMDRGVNCPTACWTNSLGT